MSSRDELCPAWEPGEMKTWGGCFPNLGEVAFCEGLSKKDFSILGGLYWGKQLFWGGSL